MIVFGWNRPSGLAALAAVGLPLLAQTPPPKANVAEVLEELTSTDQIHAAGKQVQDVASAPADVAVLTSRDLRSLGYRTLGDALGGLVGFRTNEDRAYQGLGIRGLYVLGDQNTRVLVLLDGHALNSPAELGSSKVGDDFGLPLELVDHVEVVRGPASSLYGNNAFQALVNVVSAEAARSLSGHGLLAASAGSGGLTDGWAHLRGSLQGVQVGLTLTGLNRTGTSLAFPELQPEALTADLDREERQSAYLRVQGSDWSFSALALSRLQRLASAPFQSTIGFAGNSYRNRRLAGEFRWEPRWERVRWTIRLFGDRNEFLGDYRQDGDRSGEGLTGMSYDRDPDRSLGTEVQARVFLSEQLTLTAGTEQQLHRFDGLSSSFDGAIQTGTRADYRIGNTYLEGEWRPGQAWTLVGGFQGAEWVPSTVQNVVAGEVRDQEKAATRRLTPRGALIWKPGERDVLKLLVGQGFRLPTVYERYYTDGQSQAANPGLAAEVITSTQVVWSRRWTPRLRCQAALSDFRWDHSIASDESGDMAVFRNASARIRGRALELEGTYRHGATEWYGGGGWYRWETPEAVLPNVATRSAVLRVIHRIGAASLAGEARYVGAREDASREARVPSCLTLRASLRWEFQGGWCQLSAEDLANRKRMDLVGTEYDPITRMRSEGFRLAGTLGLRF